MKTENIALIGLLIVVLGGLALILIDFSNGQQGIATGGIIDTNNPEQLESIITGDTGPGGVSIKLTPHEPINGKILFDIYVNTHSVDLSQFDLKKITSLKYKDKSISPVSVPSLRGHHSSGEIVFEIDEMPDSFSVIIKDIPKVEERIFTWSV
jgi:hypothetical protein